MPFSLADLIPMSLALRDVGLGLIELAFPESRPSLEGGYDLAVRSVKGAAASEEGAGVGPSSATWSYLFNKVGICHPRFYAPQRQHLQVGLPLGRWAVEAAVREGHEAAVLPARPLDLQQHRAAREAVGGAVFPERGTDDDPVHELPAATRSGGRR